jgi:hypothetical protein
MHIIKILIELPGELENFLTDRISRKIPWSAPRVSMDDAFDSLDSKRSSNSFGLPVGHTYLLSCLLQGDLSCLHQEQDLEPELIFSNKDYGDALFGPAISPKGDYLLFTRIHPRGSDIQEYFRSMFLSENLMMIGLILWNLEES